jgi:hypothetical protein
MVDVPDTTDGSDTVVEAPLEMVTQPTVEDVDRVFIRKTVEYIQTLPGADKNNIKIQTNTSFPSRYVLMISNLPNMSLLEFKCIKTLAPQLREILLSLKDNWIKIDVWKQGAVARKTKRKLADTTNRDWNLKTITAQDQRMLKQVLNGFANLPTFPCQFHADVTNEPPDHYSIDVITNDIVHLEELEHFKSNFRSFVKEITFVFSSNMLKLKIERASASSESGIGKRKMVVYKRSVL